MWQDMKMQGVRMCNSDWVLKYSAVTVTIDHENYDQEKKVIAHLADFLLMDFICFIDGLYRFG